ncbi:MAG: tripartite tricarboxylate transporter substrate binding protein [Burkholderiales bacterium]|nr:tripartite tricarboxylate transporter substrate binding protein [Burkholderiales bacterium]
MYSALPSALAADAGASYPSKPVRIVVPFAPGGGIDISARLVGVKLNELWGQPVLIDNRSGAGGTIGSEAAAKAAPDGYTLLAVPISHAAVGSLYKRLGYDPQHDFAPVIQLALAPNVMVVHPSVPAQSVRELIALARSRKGEVSYASGGTGSSTHLAVELFEMLTGIELAHIPYKGGQSTMVDLLSGQVFMYVGSLPATIQHVRAQRLRGLAVTSARRVPLLAALPTVAEAGVAGYEYVGWYGMLAPAGTHTDVIARLNADLNRVLRLTDVRERFAAGGADTVGGSPEQFGALLKSEMAKWAKVAAHAGIRPE